MKERGTGRIAIGLVMVAAAWYLNWSLDGLRTHLLFFPLWLGYVLFVDGLTLRRTGSSPSARGRLRYVGLFVISIPLWWLFELLNLRVANWEYVGREHFSDLEYFLLCSLAFSTVMPAVLTTAELMRSLRWFEELGRGPLIRPTERLRIGLILSGLSMLALLLTWPTLFFPLLWVSGVLLLEPVCLRLGRRSLLTQLEQGDWRNWLSLWSGVLVCAFFWEMWNADSYPKWVYHIPGVGFGKVFEMPILGYLGYLPFALQIYLVKELLLPSRLDCARRGSARAAGSPSSSAV